MEDGRFREPVFRQPLPRQRPEGGCMIFFNWISVQWDDGELFMKLLIVDDHALIREALHAVLKQLKREAVIFEASNSRQAMHIVEEHPDISLILLDINLPDRDGFSVLRELRTAMRPLLSSFSRPRMIKIQSSALSNLALWVSSRKLPNVRSCSTPLS